MKSFLSKIAFIVKYLPHIQVLIDGVKDIHTKIKELPKPSDNAGSNPQ